MTRPSKSELTAALKVFEAWLEEEVAAAERHVALSYVAGKTTPEQVAEHVGVARGLAGAAALLAAHVEVLTE